MKNIYRKKIGIVVILFFAVSTIFSQTMPMKDKFYIGYQGSFYYYPYWQDYYFPGLHSLNINFIQNYGNHSESGDTNDGGFYDEMSVYQTNVNNFMNSWGNIFQNNALIMEREKILRGAYGQLSDYQAEFVPSTTYPRYGYANRNGTEYTEITSDGDTVTGLCTGLPDNQGNMLVSGLYENEEQINFPESFNIPENNHKISYYYSDNKTDYYKWFILPRMRISVDDATGPDKKVCRIDIIPFDGANTISFDLWNYDFRYFGGGYNGDYIDLFYRRGQELQNINILATNLNNGNTACTDGKSSHPENSLVDYRIYWYGQVKLWLDRVRVMDEWAFYLFHPDLDIQLPNPYNFQGKIQQECQNNLIGGNSNFGYFYIDEYMYNNIPCIAKVNSIIKDFKSNSGLIAETNSSLIINYSGLVNKPSPDDIFEYLFSSKAITDILFMYEYPFTYKKTGDNDYSLFPLPHNLAERLPDKASFPGTVGYYASVKNQYYNDTVNYWFENDFYSGFGYNYCFIDQFRRAANFQKNHPQVRFCGGTQSHSYESPFTFNPPLPYGSLREPTNEEIRMQEYLAIAYGAKIILNFCYTTFYSSYNGNTYNDWGMENTNHSLRNLNYYNQKKYDTINNLNINLQKLGDFMYPKNEISNYFTWDETRTVDKQNVGLPYRYLNNIESYPRINGTTNFDMNNPDINKYWEVGFFNNPQHSDYKYMLVVNKRLSPEENLTGDSRKAKFTFSGYEVQGFNNWS